MKYNWNITANNLFLVKRVFLNLIVTQNQIFSWCCLGSLESESAIIIVSFFRILLWRRSSSDTYSPSDNFLSPTAVSDWLIFCCGDFILHPKKMKITKTQILIKTTKKCQKSICKYKVAFFTLNLCHWLVM